MRRWANYHSHTHFCDGTGPPEAYIREAIAQKFPAYGFSSHAPLPFETDWNVKAERLPEYIAEITRLKKKYARDIQVYMGLEIDYLPDGSDTRDYAGLDYRIASIHFVDRFKDGTPWNIDTSAELFSKGLLEIFENDMRQAALRFWDLTRQMIEALSPDVIGHLDKIKMFNKNQAYFSEQETWYTGAVENTLDLIAEKQCRVEINTRGYYRYGQPDLYPGEWIIRRLAERNIPVVLNSDAHKPEEISQGMSYAAEIMQKCGIREVYALYDNSWKPFEYTREGILFR
ncbi:MAG: histidinol-phosphatase [Bacteroidales bacterium]|nr:histidinol-phosphatase [Bacteroidales bacterium]